MEDWITIETRDGSTRFEPGETVEGTVAWRLSPPPRSVEVRLLWYTQGKGDQDVVIVESEPFATPGAEDRRGFVFRVPEGPFSFSGKLISLEWALEAVAEPRSRAQRLAITVSPTRREILLHAGLQGESAG
jgi:hypothetical protein